jgi:hypothetical protein
MAMDFRLLTVETVSNKSGNENTHFGPTKTGANQPPRSFDTRMMDVVK